MNYLGFLLIECIPQLWTAQVKFHKFEVSKTEVSQVWSVRGQSPKPAEELKIMRDSLQARNEKEGEPHLCPDL